MRTSLGVASTGARDTAAAAELEGVVGGVVGVGAPGSPERLPRVTGFMVAADGGRNVRAIASAATTATTAPPATHGHAFLRGRGPTSDSAGRNVLLVESVSTVRACASSISAGVSWRGVPGTRGCGGAE